MQTSNLNFMQNMIKPYNFMQMAILSISLIGFSQAVFSDENTSQTGEQMEPGSPSTLPAENPSEAAVESSSEMPANSASETPADIATETSTETAAQAPADTTTPAASPPKSEHVLRALLTTGIENREPVDEIVSLDKNHGRIYFFTEFTGLKGKVVKHRWEYDGKVMGEVN
ncbi:MAG: hypothetical protein LJE85_04050, partial [Gammaproteobacteria bacterium]|nr:hypothetical protein [Gammaproteobacteria bacterium]